MKEALYDLSDQPTTFDFAAWSVIARTMGVESVYFIIDGPISDWKYPRDIAWRRFINILLPVARLAGFKVSAGPRKAGIKFTYYYGAVDAMYRKLGRIDKIPLIPGDGDYVTVTLRNSFRGAYRNSNPELWFRVINKLEERIRVVVLRDAEDGGITVDDRFKLYCGAKLNIGSSGGPMALCHFSDAPYLTTNMLPRGSEELEKYMDDTGFPRGSQFSFRTERQKLIWEPDDYDTIIKTAEEML